MPDTLIIHGPPMAQSAIAHTRARLGLPAHTQAFEDFIADEKAASEDITRPMIGCAVTRWKLYPAEDDDA